MGTAGEARGGPADVRAAGGVETIEAGTVWKWSS